jgi:acyl carrier protein
MKPTSQEDCLTSLIAVLQDAFNDDDLHISRETQAADVDGWDSLANIRLMVMVEKTFHVRFSAAEISALENVGDLADLVWRKTQ